MGAAAATGSGPDKPIWDNESGIGRGKRHTEGVGAFIGTLATRLQRLKPYDPESKGVVERRNGFFETSFMPGRTFTSPADFNVQFTGGADASCARSRPVRSTWANQVRLAREYYVRVGRNDYSAHRELVGRFVEVAADLSRVEVRHQGCFVAARDRVWARGMTTTDPVHVTAANVLRAQHEQPAQPAVDPHDALVRDLADYDRAFGLIDGRADGVIDGEVT